MRRLQALDRFLLLIIVPLWLGWFVLHVRTALTVGTAEPGVYVSSAGASEYPVVRSLRGGFAVATSGLRPGDRLTRIGEADLRGAGALGFFALAQQEMGTDQKAPLAYLRDGTPGELVLEYTPAPLPIRFVLVSLSFAFTAVVILLRAPRSRAARYLSRALLLFSFGFLRPWGGPAELTHVAMAMALVVGTFLLPMAVIAALAFPDDSAPYPRFDYVWPFVFAPIAPVFLSGIIGFPLFGPYSELLDPIIDPLIMILLSLLGVVVLVVLTRNYRRADQLGKRKVRWVVYGLYVSLTPILILTAISMTDPELWWLSDASEIFHVLIPIFIFFAIVRFNLFDIDRLISRTASYSVLLGAGLIGVLMVVPPLAQAASRAVGVDASISQLALSTVLVAVAIPAHRYLHPRIDRWFFPERHNLGTEIQNLLRELSGSEAPSELARHMAQRIDELLRPESCVVYVQTSEAYEPVFVRGRAIPPVFDPRNPIIAALGTHGAPFAAENWSKPRQGPQLSPFDRAALETLDVAVLIPIRRGGGLFAFICLGPKRSGDIYTPTDLALLSAVADRVAAELLRFDDAEVIRQSQAMQKAFQRYVPGAVAEELTRGQSLEAGEREVSVLFVDLRGYTSYSESRPAQEIFSTVSRYTEKTSQILRKHGGSVVEFHGDGMMAVFGAPQELAHKERAAVEAGREIVIAVEALGVETGQGPQAGLSVGVGIATGDSFVGNIRAVDRLIWTAIGNPPNLAARLQSLTRDFEAAMVIDAATWQASGAARADFEQRERVSIRGYAELQTAYVLPFRSRG